MKLYNIYNHSRLFQLYIRIYHYFIYITTLTTFCRYFVYLNLIFCGGGALDILPGLSFALMILRLVMAAWLDGIPENSQLVKVAFRGVFQRCVETTLENSNHQKLML